MNKQIGLLVFFLMLGTLTVAQHKPHFDYDKLLTRIDLSLRKGNKKALRDLGTLLDVSDYKEKVLHLFKENVIFPDREISLNGQTTKQQFLDFYYSEENNIYFSPTAHVFYTEGLENISVDYKIQPIRSLPNSNEASTLRIKSADIYKSLSKGQYELVLQEISDIALIENQEAFEILKKLSEEKMILRAKGEYRKQLSMALVRALSNFPNELSLTRILELLEEGHIPSPAAQKYLTILTNVNLSHQE
ncbi:MAG: hypothetical protein HKN16_03870, partial [Saprospiraceae bacterium]|nr:hypothetical protein [Saprospiraceae bacterium]